MERVLLSVLSTAIARSTAFDSAEEQERRASAIEEIYLVGYRKFKG